MSVRRKQEIVVTAVYQGETFTVRLHDWELQIDSHGVKMLATSPFSQLESITVRVVDESD